MALQQYGLNTYSFGFTDSDAQTIAAAVGLTPQEGTISIEPEVEAEGKDKYNRTVAYVVDDAGKKTLQLSGYISSNSLFAAAIGKTFTYDSKVYICKSREKTVKKDDFWMGTISAVSYSQINSSSKTQIAA